MNKYLITDFGAKSEKETIQTKEIQACINKCYFSGGGIVEIPTGKFIVGGLRLRSNVTLHLLENAQLIGSQTPTDYNILPYDSIEPLAECDKTTAVWLPVGERENYDHINKCGSNWNNAILRAIDSENIAVIGENGSYIDGMDCFDESGEEHYRGPHAINFHRCKNISFSGYVVKNSANWAHALFDCENITMSNVQVMGGHDGIHITSCSNVNVTACKFFTGDDCIAGIDNLNVYVNKCELNTACSGLRFGGTNAMINDCSFYGPAKYLFRGSLSDAEKRNGNFSTGNHRFNMLSAFTYYSDFSRTIVNEPGNIIIKNCTMKNTDRFLHYNFSGNEPWQCNRPLASLVFDNVKSEGIQYPITAYGSSELALQLEIKNSSFDFAANRSVPFMQLCHFERIILKNVNVKNIDSPVLIKKWSSSGEIIIDNLNGFDGKVSELAKEEFVCKPI